MNIEFGSFNLGNLNGSQSHICNQQKVNAGTQPEVDKLGNDEIWIIPMLRSDENLPSEDSYEESSIEDDDPRIDDVWHNNQGQEFEDLADSLELSREEACNIFSMNSEVNYAMQEEEPVLVCNSYKLNTVLQYSDISQVDGSNDVKNASEINKYIYSINCEVEELVVCINFFRGLDNLWNSYTDHHLCEMKFKDDCFFCLFRSMQFRLNTRREKGPRGLKPLEIVTLLPIYEKELKWAWSNIRQDEYSFISNTLKLLLWHEKNLTRNLFLDGTKKCDKCKVTIDDFIFNMQIKVLREEPIAIKDVLDMCISDCCCWKPLLHTFVPKYFIIQFDHPTNVNIVNKLAYKSQTISYKCHLSEEIYIG